MRYTTENPGLRRPPRPTLPPAGPAPEPAPQPRRRAVRVLPAALVLVLVGSFGWIALRGAAWTRQVEADLAAVEARLDEAEAAYRAVPMLSDAQARALRRSLNAAHVATARRVGTAPVAARAALDSAAVARGLVRIGSDSTRVIGGGRHSVPYLTPGAAAALDSIAVRFRRRLVGAGLPAFRFTVSSAWRSAEDQAALVRVNLNAARGRSSHEYATTFDLPYRRFSYAGPGGLDLPVPSPTLPPFLQAYVREETERRAAARFEHLAREHPDALDAALGRTLVTLETDGVLLALRERRQPVYHVTAAQAPR